MARWGRPALRERFDDAEHPDPQGPPSTHRCDLYVATDAAMCGEIAGFGALVERPDGSVIARWERTGAATDNNDAELRALHFGLDRLAQLSVPATRVGILLDHDVLAQAVAACATPGVESPTRPPSRTSSTHHWGGITARVASIPHVRIGIVSGHSNPAHGLANRVAAD